MPSCLEILKPRAIAPSCAPIDYSDITELPGSRASREELSRLRHRYRTAAAYCFGKDVLEVGCGAGQGLGYLAKRARRVVGGDCTHANLLRAQEYYAERANLVRLDAHDLPFPDASFDVLLLFETVYYLREPGEFLAESRRVLRRNGVLIICTVNKDWRDFHPSPWRVRYFSAPELAERLRAQRFEVELFGAYPVSEASVRDRLLSLIKRAAVRSHLMPGTMKRKELLKRIFFGKLAPIPPEIDGDGPEYEPPVPISAEVSESRFKVLYAMAYAR
ncbi:MAG TPA: class I SAM-dependent methyltransferase [Terriglobia bacterium]|nr:class I SAM-dependent methyltransferase [Terriglobia bacterium]